MTVNQEIELWLGHSARAYAALPNNRQYANDDEGASLALAAVARAWQEKRAEENEGFSLRDLEQWFVHQLAPAIPEMVQFRPNETPPLPELPRDPLGGTFAVNSWVTDDLASQAVVEKRFPTLAPIMKRLAQDKGFSFAHHAELEDAAASRATAQNIIYGPAEHATNPLREGGSLTAQSAFMKSNPPEVVEVFKREAKPLRLPWQRGSVNLTRIGQLLREAPELGAIIQRAQQMESGWIEEKLASAKQAESAARQQREQAERLLKGQVAT
ncbi:MAG: hypothetical protein ACR2NX_03435 [Chthoniobacterales bacterium]